MNKNYGMLTSFSKMIDCLNSLNRELEVIVLMADSESTLCSLASFINIVTINVRVYLIGNPSSIKEKITKNKLKDSLGNNKTIICKANTIKDVFSSLFTLLNSDKNQFIMKGNISTDKLMRGLFDIKEKVLKEGSIISHLRLFETPHGLSIMSDGGINVISNINDFQKRGTLFKKILRNTTRVADILGLNPTNIFFPDKYKGIEGLHNITSKYFHDPANFPNIIQFPSISPANIIYKALCITPWIPIFENNINNVFINDKIDVHYFPGICSLFNKGKKDNFLLVTAPKENSRLSDKKKLLEQLISISKSIGIKSPIIALLDFTEKYQSFIDTPSIKDCKELEFFINEKFSKEAIVEGPMAFDLAISDKSARVKNYSSKVAGNANILFLPDYISGVLLIQIYKHWKRLELPWKAADVTFGAKAPIIIASRSDSSEHKLRSIISAAYLSTLDNR